MPLAVSGALACSEAHEYVETARTEFIAKVDSVFSLSGQYGHLVNVSARLPDRNTFLITIPDKSIAPGSRLKVEKITLEDRLQNGEAWIQYQLVDVGGD